MPADDLLQVVCDEMPPFPERESALLSRLVNKHGDASDKRTWHVGGRDVNKDKDAERYRGLSKRQDTAASIDGTPLVNGHSSTANGSVSTSQPIDNVMDSLIGLEMSPVQSPQELSPIETPGTGQSLSMNGASTSPTIETAPLITPTLINYTPGAERFLQRLIYSAEGILFEDAQLQIGLKSEYHGHLGRIALYFGNKISASFESFTITVESTDSKALSLTLDKLPPSTLEGMNQITQSLEAECKSFFSNPPILRISYLAGSLQDFTLKLPIHLTKFVEPVKFSSQDFFERWRQIGSAPLEAQKVFPIRLTSSGVIDIQRNARVIGGCKFGILDKVDSNPNNIVAAGVVHMSGSGKVGCLLRLEPNAQAKLCRLTIRSTSEEVSAQLLDSLCRALAV